MFDDGFAIASDAAAPAIPVAVNVTDPLTPTALAVRVFGPAAFPSVQLPTVAMPDAFVAVVPPVMDPPPAPAKKLTDAPLTGFPFASWTFTDGGVGTAVPAIAVCPSPAFIETDPAEPAVAVAVKVKIRSAIALG